MSTLYPTHACFDDAFEFFEMEHKRGVPLALLERRYTVVHGICLGDEGEPYAHGWVEQTDWRAADRFPVPRVTVWQAGLMDVEGKRQRVFFESDKHGFYEAYRVQKITRYTLLEAGAENLRTGHQGPWVDEYRALLANGDHRILGRTEVNVNVVPGSKP